MTYFFDNCVAVQVPRVLACFEWQVEHLGDRYPQRKNIPDEEWIPEIGALGYVVITADKNLRVNPTQRVLLANENITTFFLVKSVFCMAPVEEQAVWFIRHWKKLDALARKSPRGTHYRVALKPDFELLPPI